jgi:hypothetical protein
MGEVRSIEKKRARKKLEKDENKNNCITSKWGKPTFFSGAFPAGAFPAVVGFFSAAFGGILVLELSEDGIGFELILFLWIGDGG